MPNNYEVQRFQLITFASEREENAEYFQNSERDVFMKPYIYRNEMNLNLPNAPAQDDDRTRFEIILPSSITHNPFSAEANLQKLINEFQTKILHDYPSIPCAYCSILMMKDSTKWLPYNPEE